MQVELYTIDPLGLSNLAVERGGLYTQVELYTIDPLGLSNLAVERGGLYTQVELYTKRFCWYCRPCGDQEWHFCKWPLGTRYRIYAKISLALFGKNRKFHGQAATFT